MTEWMDVAGIVFACVTANHLGLVDAAAAVAKCRRLPVVSCPKCLTFWSTLAYMAVTAHGVIPALATSFLASYAALWVELLEGFTDKLYTIAYDKIYPAPDDHAPAAMPDEGDPAGAVPELQEICKNEH